MVCELYHNKAVKKRGWICLFYSLFHGAGPSWVLGSGSYRPKERCVWGTERARLYPQHKPQTAARMSSGFYGSVSTCTPIPTSAFHDPRANVKWHKTLGSQLDSCFPGPTVPASTLGALSRTDPGLASSGHQHTGLAYSRIVLSHRNTMQAT